MTPRILVVDDDDAIREIVALVLELDGYDALQAACADEAEEILVRQAPDFVVLDVMMPRRDGIDLLVELRTSERWRDLPVLLLSAKTSDADLWRGWSSGADYYLTKPFEPDQLLRSVRHILRERSRLLP